MHVSSASLYPPSTLSPGCTPMLPGLQPSCPVSTSSCPLCIPWACQHSYVQCLRLHACRLHPMSPGLFPHVPRLQSHVAPILSTLYPYLRGSVTFLLVFLFSVPLFLVPVALLFPRSSSAHRHLVAARRSAQAPPRPFLTRGAFAHTQTRRMRVVGS